MSGFAQNKIPAIDMVLVKGGIFLMKPAGMPDNEPERIKVADFHIGRYEVTQAQWTAVMGKNPSKVKGDSLPVTNVDWMDVKAFIKRLNGKTGKKYRLPTDVEWEYAARGGKLSKGYRYSGSNNVVDVSWNVFNSDKRVHKTGTKKPNELGIYDMSGNVWEICEWSKFDDFYSDEMNLLMTGGPTAEVRRGGSFMNIHNMFFADHISSGVSPDYYENKPDVGFRLALNAK
jgi:formylglycine-generating enzyme required for sulfatase activity